MRKLQSQGTKPHQVAVLSGFGKNNSSSSSFSGSASFGVLMLPIMRVRRKRAEGLEHHHLG